MAVKYYSVLKLILNLVLEFNTKHSRLLFQLPWLELQTKSDDHAPWGTR
jgi:hypothetical protein